MSGEIEKSFRDMDDQRLLNENPAAYRYRRMMEGRLGQQPPDAHANWKHEQEMNQQAHDQRMRIQNDASNARKLECFADLLAACKALLESYPYYSWVDDEAIAQAKAAISKAESL